MPFVFSHAGGLLTFLTRHAIDTMPAARCPSSWPPPSGTPAIDRAADPFPSTGSGCWAGRSWDTNSALPQAPARLDLGARNRVAVGVKQILGHAGEKRSCRTASWMYSGRKSCPHCETQCASSIAKEAARARSDAGEIAQKRVGDRRSGGREQSSSPRRARRACPAALRSQAGGSSGTRRAHRPATAHRPGPSSAR